jgi:23S rRNA (uracil1939-C5)-methyltransferase
VDGESLRAAVCGASRGEGEISLLHTVNDALSDAVVPGRTRLLAGTGRLEEKIAGLVIGYGAFAFAQVNPGALSVFYRELRENPLLAGGGKTLDIFCGSGGLGIVLAGPEGEITGIELDPTAVESARENSLRNGIRNTLYLAGKARRILRENLGAWRGKFDLAAVNPPRSGLSPRVLERILAIAPKTIVYSSCNPKTFAAEAGAILRDYRLVHARPFDFFPHTPHLELLALFERRNPGAAAESRSEREAGG